MADLSEQFKRERVTLAGTISGAVLDAVGSRVTVASKVGCSPAVRTVYDAVP